MKPVAESGVTNNSQWAAQQKQSVPPPAQQKPLGKTVDKVELSAAARKLAAEEDAHDESSADRVAAARSRLDSGELYTPKALRKAADSLLRSGDL